MPREFLNSLLEISRERLKSPIWRTYSISFILFNWRPILFLIYSNVTIEKKFEQIELKYSSYWSFIIPLLITVVVILGFPFILWAMESVVSKPNNARKNLKNRTILAQSEHKEKMAESEFIIQDKKSGTKTIEEFETKIKNLEREKEELRESIKFEIETVNSTSSLEKTTYTKQIESLKLSIASLTDLNDSLSEQLNIAQNENVKVFDFDRVKSIYNQWKSDERDSFYDLFDGDGSYNSEILSKSLVRDYINLGLVVQYSDHIVNTTLAMQLYKYIYIQKSSEEQVKKDDFMIISLTEDEKKTIRSFPNKIDVRFDIYKSDIELIRYLENESFVRRNNNRYFITEQGKLLRNLLLIKSIEGENERVLR